jgi:hypothetical protein
MAKPNQWVEKIFPKEPHLATPKGVDMHKKYNPGETIYIMEDPHAGGVKLDDGKVKAGLVVGGFAPALLEVSKVGTVGAQKYSPNGWKSVPNGLDRYNDAKVRHMLLAESEGLYDNETGLLHAAHEAWNALAKLQLLLETLEQSKE